MRGGGAPSYMAGLFRLMKKNKIRAAAEIATTPPATPPAMAPALEEDFPELDVLDGGDGVEVGGEYIDAVDWEMAEEAAEPINAPGAISGVSEKGRWGIVSRRRRKERDHTAGGIRLIGIPVVLGLGY